MLMRHDDNGWHNAGGLEIEEMKKNGWIESSDAEYQAMIVHKKKLEAKTDHVIITPQDAPEKGKPGRKPKNLMGGIYGDNTNKD